MGVSVCCCSARGSSCCWFSRGWKVSSFTLTGATIGSAQVSVTATDPAGESAEQTAEVTIVEAPTPGPPTNVTLTANDTTLTLSWDEPANTRDFGSIAYEVQFRRDGGPWSTTGVTIDGTSATLTGVRGSSYRARVLAKSGDARSPWAQAGPETVPEAPTPGLPTGVEAYLDGGHPAVTWQSPANAGDVTVTGYEVAYRTTADRMWRNASCGNLGPSARKCRAPSAAAGQEYEFRVRALSAGGAGDWEESSTVTVPTKSVPGRPTDLSVEIEDGQVVLTWQAPDDADETGVTAYEGAAWRYRHPEPGDAANKRVDAQRPYYIAENIAPGCALEARVRAVGRAGTSGYVYLDRGLRDPWPQDTVCEADRPATPTGVKATPKARRQTPVRRRQVRHRRRRNMARPYRRVGGRTRDRLSGLVRRDAYPRPL